MFIHGFASPPPPTMSGDGPTGLRSVLMHLYSASAVMRARTEGVTPNLCLRFPPKASAFVAEGRKGLLLTESVHH